MDFTEFLLWLLWAWIIVVCLWTFVWIVIDVFRDHTLNGWAKTGWLILLVVLPLLGCLIYLIARGNAMASRQAEQYASVEQAQADYIRSIANTASPAAEIERAKGLLDSGAITQSEFDDLKARTLA